MRENTRHGETLRAFAVSLQVAPVFAGDSFLVSREWTSVYRYLISKLTIAASASSTMTTPATILADGDFTAASL
jgi:hypothetical protein